MGWPILVDSSSVFYLVTRLCMPASAGAERPKFIFECVVYSLDFASDVGSPAELSTHLPNLRMRNTAT